MGDWAFAKVVKYDNNPHYYVQRLIDFMYVRDGAPFESFNAADAFVRLVCQ